MWMGLPNAVAIAASLTASAGGTQTGGWWAGRQLSVQLSQLPGVCTRACAPSWCCFNFMPPFNHSPGMAPVNGQAALCGGAHLPGRQSTQANKHKHGPAHTPRMPKRALTHALRT